LKNSGDVLCCAAVNGLMKSIFGAAAGAAVPRNAESGSAL
jgi:hypothetical protein